MEGVEVDLGLCEEVPDGSGRLECVCHYKAPPGLGNELCLTWCMPGDVRVK